MRKVYVLSLFILTMASAAFAQQREMDWAMDTVFKPTQITSQANNSSTIEVDYIAKHLSGDSATMGDTVYTTIQVTQLNGSVIFTVSYFQILNKTMRMNDTINVKTTLTVPLAVPNSGNIVLLIRTDCNNADIKAEPVPETNNNVAGGILTWYNSKGWGVGVEDKFITNLFDVYPNPANGDVNVAANIASSNDTKVRILDLNGRVVAEQTMDETFNTNIDVAGLNPGLYMVEVSNGVVTTTQKLQVVH